MKKHWFINSKTVCLKKNHMAILYFSHKNATYLNKQERKEKKTLSEYFSVNQEKI